MTVRMFDNQTYSFLISVKAEVLVRPSNADQYGSNLINSLVDQGMDSDTQTRLLQEIAQGQRSSIIFDLNDHQWLIQTAPVHRAIL